MPLQTAKMALSDLQKEAYRAVLRAVAATQLDWVRIGACLMHSYLTCESHAQDFQGLLCELCKIARWTLK